MLGVSWLSLDAGENDPTRFWAYVRTFLDEGAPVRELLVGAVARGAAPHQTYVGQLLSAFGSASKEGVRGPALLSALIEPLTERELQVLRLLATDLTSPEIAGALFVSTNTVRTHIQHIYQKLDAHSRHEAVVRVQELGIL